MDEKTKRLIKNIKDARSNYSEDNFVFVIPQFMSKSFTSYCSMREDLILIREYVTRLNEEVDKIIVSALTYSTISLYGKCFTDAAKSRAPKLEPSELFEKGTELHETHEYLMNLRHHFIAHRGDTEGEVEAAYLLIPKAEGEPQVRFSRLKQMSFNEDQRQRIMNLIDFLIAEIIKKIQKAGEKTYKAYLMNFTPEQMSSMMINNMEEKEEY